MINQDEIKLTTLASHEVEILKSIVSRQSRPKGPIHKNAIDSDLTSKGFTDAQSGVGQMRLMVRGLIQMTEDDTGTQYMLTDAGILWLFNNEEVLV